MWRIMGFNITKMEPAVTAISVHLSSSRTNHQYQQLTRHSSTLSSLDHYFLRPQGTFLHNNMVRTFDSISYSEYFCLFPLAKFDGRHSQHQNYYIEQSNTDGSPPMHVILRSTSHRHLSESKK